MGKRKVNFDGKKQFEYDFTKEGSGYRIQPPKWSNPFFVHELERADQILTDVFRLRVIEKLGHP